MARCWTCGTSVSGWSHTCSSCKGLSEIKGLQKEVESYHGDISERLDYLAEVQQEGFNALRDTLSAGLSEIASAIEWGFGELSWQLQQQTDVLRSIDHTLKTPSETKANEWRLHAEELRRRGVLEESEEFFLKALNEYRLEYRIYVGLAETYLQMNRFDKAKVFLEKSLPHAPKKEIDYKSYSYRLIGHMIE
ncbi:MAG: tetratricopeptide repeat protein [Thermodesulfovibrionales bacterium]|nr:tetratricopeptide repeat protein [Thermodesulfovibrionales bacterium]